MTTTQRTGSGLELPPVRRWDVIRHPSLLLFLALARVYAWLMEEI